MKTTYLLILIALVGMGSLGCGSSPKTEMVRQGYPGHWWQAIEGDAASWEISPDDAEEGEVILSKRNELGILSNFAPTPFEFEGKKYASLEGFWQSMKYPEDQEDPRSKYKGWPYTRAEVEQLVAFKAKRAGDFGSKAMKALGIDCVSYKGERMPYRTSEKGKHYQLIRRAMLAKLNQNTEVKEVLLKTTGLRLKPDHEQSDHAPPAWRYYKIWEEIRDDLLRRHQ